MVDICPKRQFRFFIKRFLPFFCLQKARLVVEAAFTLSQNFDAGKNFAGSKEHSFKSIRVVLLVVAINSCKVHQRWCVVFEPVNCLSHDIRRGRDHSVYLTMRVFGNLQENQRAFADKLVDDQCRYYD